MPLPLTNTELLVLIARETARMSYPGSMSRGKKPVVRVGTKHSLEDYFATRFPMLEAWSQALNVAENFEAWHQVRVQEIASAIANNVSPHNNSSSVAAKFLNTFLHQLMKYENCRSLWPHLHLPLDRRVFGTLCRLDSQALADVLQHFKSSPYALPYITHLEIQSALYVFMQELNTRPGAEFQLRSRIELNWLWLQV
jgi:hypothetical protein